MWFGFLTDALVSAWVTCCIQVMDKVAEPLPIDSTGNVLRRIAAAALLSTYLRRHAQTTLIRAKPFGGERTIPPRTIPPRRRMLRAEARAVSGAGGGGCFRGGRRAGQRGGAAAGCARVRGMHNDGCCTTSGDLRVSRIHSTTGGQVPSVPSSPAVIT